MSDDLPAVLWRLWRQDDHGNEVPIRDFADKGDAEAACQRFNDGMHHQTYWVARVER